MNTRATGRGWLLWGALGTLYVVWGSTYLAIRVVVETIPPLLAAGTRFLAAGAVLGGALVVVGGLQRFRVARAEAAGAAGVSMLTLFAAFSLLFVGETKVPSGLAALLIASIPLWVVVLRLIARENIPTATLVAVVVGFAGVGVLVVPGDRGGGAPILWLLIVVGAAVAEAIGSFFAQRVRLPADALVGTTIQMLAAGTVTVIAALAAGEGRDVDFQSFSTESLVAFAYLVLPGSVLAYTAFVWLLQNAPISTATTYAYVNPVVALFLGWAVLAETITVLMVVGAAAIVASVSVVVRGEAQR